MSKWNEARTEHVYTEDGMHAESVVLPDYAVRDVYENGCTIPRVKRVEWSFKPASESKPATLATVVFFGDGSKAVVKNCPTDPVETEERELSDGSKILVASERSKETGLVYAILKRLMSKVNGDGLAVDGGLGSSLKKTAEAGIDQNLVAAEKKLAKKKLAAEAMKPAEKKAKQKTAADAFAGMSAAFEKLNACFGKISAQIAKFKTEDGQ